MINTIGHYVPPLGQSPLSFSVGSPIVPGEPIAISWRLQVITTMTPPYTSVAVSLTSGSPGGVQLWSSPSIPTFSVNLGRLGLWEDTGQQTEILTFAVGSAEAQMLYHPGSKVLQLQVLPEGSAMPLIEEATLDVNLGEVSGDWWNWTSTPMTVAWKSPYTLIGIFSNKLPFSELLNVRATLMENGSSSPVPSLDLGPIASGGNSGPVSFGTLKQDWQWFDDITFLNTGPTVKTFSYAVSLNLQDPYGNQYQVTSPSLSITVAVPLSKINDQTAALAGAANAVNLAAAAAIAAASVVGLETAAYLFGAAATAYAIAQAFAAAAKDPVEPDPGYRERVHLDDVTTPVRPGGLPALDALANLHSIYLKWTSVRAALPKVEGRILGAYRAGDVVALDLQMKTYSDFLQQLLGYTAELPDATAKTINAIQNDAVLDKEASRATILQWHEKGVPAEVVTAWKTLGQSDEMVRLTIALVADMPPEIITMPIGALIQRISQHCIETTNTIARELPQITSDRFPKEG